MESRAPSPVSPGADQALVEGLRRGEAAALDAAFARHRERLFRFLVRLSGRRDLAEDALQDTFVQLARHARCLREHTDLPAWLFTVARNALGAARRRERTVDRSRFVVEPRPPAPDPEQRAIEVQAGAALARAFAALDEDARAVLLLGAEGTLRSDQAAAILGLTATAFRKRLERARAALASRLASDEAIDENRERGAAR